MISIGTITGKIELQDAWTNVSKAVEASLGSLGSKAETAAGKVAHVGGSAAAAAPSVLSFAGSFKVLENAAAELTHHLHDPVTALGELREGLEAPSGAIKNLVAGLATALPGAAVATVAAFGAIGVAEALLVEQLFEVTEGAAATGVAIEEFALKAQISVASASELRFVSKALGKDVDSLGNAMFMMSRRIGEGSTAVQQGLRSLGLSWKEFSGLSPDKQLLQVSDALRALPPEVNKATIVFDIMGRQGREMLPLLLRPMRELVEQGRELGVAWSEDDVHAAHEFEVATNKLRFEIGRFGTALGKDMMPAFSALVEEMSRSKAVMEGIPMLAHGVAIGIDAIFQIRPGAVLIVAALAEIDRLLGMMPGHTDAAAEGLKHLHEEQAKGQPVPMPSHLAPTSVPPMASHANAAQAAADAQADATRLAKINTDLLTESTTKLSAGITDYIKNALRHHHTTEEISKALVDARLAGEEAKPTIEALARAHTTAQQAADAHAKALADIAGASIPLTDTQRALASSLLAQGVGHGEVAKAVGVSMLAIQKFAEVERSALTLGISGSAASKDLDTLRAAWEAQPPAVQATVAAQQLLLNEYGKFSASLTTVKPEQAAFVAQLNEAALAGGRMSLSVADIGSNVDGLGKTVKDTGHTLMVEMAAWEASMATLNERTGVAFALPDFGTAVKFDEVGFMNDFVDFQDRMVVATHTGLARQLAEQEIAKRKELEVLASKYGKGTELYEDGAKKIEEIFGRLKGETIGTAIAQDLDALSQSFANLAQVAGPSAGKVFESIGQIVAAVAVAHRAASSIKTAFDALATGFKDLGKNIKGAGAEIMNGMLGLASGIVGGIGAVASATNTGNLKKDIVGGALTTANLGAGVASGAALLAGATAKGAAVAGVWGAVAGIVVGMFVAVLRGRDTRQLMHDVGEEWGKDISKGLAEQIKRDAKMFGGDKEAAKLWDLSKIIGEQGGLNADNIGTGLGKLHDIFTALQTGAFTASQAVTVLDDNFKTFADFLTKGGTLASKQLLEIMRLSDDAKLHSAAVMEFIAAQANVAAEGFNKIGKNFLTLVTGFQTGSDDMKRLIESLNGSLTGVGGSGPKEAPEAHIGVEERNRKKTSTGGFAPEFIADIATALTRLEPIAESTFGALLAGGASFTQALASMAPGLEEIQRALAATGQHADGFLGQLIGWEAIVGKNKELFEILQGVDQSLTGLTNSNRMTQESFSALASITTDSINTLLGQGVATADAFQMAQPQLQKIWELEQEFGYSLDAATQKMLDQAEAAGTVGDAHRTVQDQMLRATQDIRDAVVGLAGVFGVDLPKNMQDAADRAAERARDIQGSFDKIDPTIHVHYDVPALHVPTPSGVTIPTHYGSPTGSPPPSGSGGDYSSHYGQYHALGGPVYLAGGGAVGDGWMAGIARHHAAVNYLANGGTSEPQPIVMEPRGTDTVPAMLTPGEVVIPRGVVDQLGMSFFNRLISGTFTAPPIHTMLDVDTNTASQQLRLIEEARSFVLTAVADTTGVDAQMQDLSRDVAVGIKPTGLSALVDALDAMERRYRTVAVSPDLDQPTADAVARQLDALAQVRETIVSIQASGLETATAAIESIPRRADVKAFVIAHGVAAALAKLAEIPRDKQTLVHAVPDGFDWIDSKIGHLPTTHPVVIPFEPAGVAQAMSQIARIPREVGVVIRPNWQQQAYDATPAAYGSPHVPPQYTGPDSIRLAGSPSMPRFALGGSVTGAAAALAASVVMAVAPPQALAMGGPAVVAQAQEMTARSVAPQPIYAADGARVAATFAPVGTDTVPAMLTPGEYVLPTRVVDRVGVRALDALRADRATIVNVAQAQVPRAGDVYGGNVVTTDNRMFHGPFSAVTHGPSNVSTLYRSLGGSFQTELSDRRDCSSTQYALGGAVSHTASSAVSHFATGGPVSQASFSNVVSSPVSTVRHYALGGSTTDASRAIYDRSTSVSYGGRATDARVMTGGSFSDARSIGGSSFTDARTAIGGSFSDARRYASSGPMTSARYAYGGPVDNVHTYSFGGHVTTSRYDTAGALDASRYALGGAVSSVQNSTISGASSQTSYGGPVQMAGDRIASETHYGGNTVSASSALSRFETGGPVQITGDRISQTASYAFGGAVGAPALSSSHYAYGGPVHAAGDRIETVHHYAFGGAVQTAGDRIAHVAHLATGGDVSSLAHYAYGGPVQTLGDRISTVQNYSTGGQVWSWRQDGGAHVAHYASGGQVAAASTAAAMPVARPQMLASGGVVAPTSLASQDVVGHLLLGNLRVPPISVDLSVKTDAAARTLSGLTAPDVPVVAVADVADAERAISGLPDARTLAVKPDVSSLDVVSRAIGAIPSAIDMTVTASGAGAVEEQMATVSRSRDIALTVVSRGLSEAVSGVASIPTSKDVSIAARTFGLVEAKRDIDSIPASKSLDVDVQTSGISETLSLVAMIPEQRSVAVIVQTFGISAALELIATIPERKDVPVIVAANGIDTTLAQIDTIPHSRPFDVVLATVNLQQVLNDIASIPTRVDVAVVYTSTTAPGGSQPAPSTGSGGGISTTPTPPGSFRPPEAHGSPGMPPTPTPYVPNSPVAMPYSGGPAIGSGGSGGGSFHLSIGGLVPEPSVAQAVRGTFGTDRVRALLTPGEFVVPAPTVAAIGVKFFSRLVSAGAVPSSQREVLDGAWTGSRTDVLPDGPPGLYGSVGPSWSAAPQAALANRPEPRFHAETDDRRSTAGHTVIVRNEFTIKAWDGADVKRVLSQPQTQSTVADAAIAALERGGIRVDKLRRLAKEPKL